MELHLHISDTELEWEDNASLKILQNSKQLVTIEGNREGLISLAKQLLTVAYSSENIFVHHQAECFTESGGYWYGDLDEGSLELSIEKHERPGRKNPDSELKESNGKDA